MIKIISTNNEEIDIDDQFMIMEDANFIIFEFSNFNWFDHTNDCKDCGSLLKSMTNYQGTWYLFMNGKFRLIDFLFGAKEDWSTGHFSYSERSPNFVDDYYYSNSLGVTRLRFKLLPCNPEILINEIDEAKGFENYGRCAYLHRATNPN